MYSWKNFEGALMGAEVRGRGAEAKKASARF